MNDIKKPVETGSNSVVNTAEIVFGETKYTIKRLRAGKFYSALKVYMDMIKEVTPKTPASQGEQTVEFDQIIVSMFQTWPEKMIEFIAICLDENEITSEKIKVDAYPEQITLAFRTCLELNRVAENLKNFAAPIGELGAKVQDKGK